MQRSRKRKRSWENTSSYRSTHLWRGYREIVMNNWSIDRLIQECSFNEIRICYPTLSSANKLKQKILSRSCAMYWGQEHRKMHHRSMIPQLLDSQVWTHPLDQRSIRSDKTNRYLPPTLLRSYLKLQRWPLDRRLGQRLLIVTIICLEIATIDGPLTSWNSRCDKLMNLGSMQRPLAQSR